MKKSLLLLTTPISYLAVGFVLCVSACAPNKIIAKKVKHQFSSSALIAKYQVGFALYDRAHQHMIYEKDAQKYFTPASNTKLFTFYAALKMLPDSVATLRYVEQGDSLIFWGTGDPSFLHSQLKGNQGFAFLKRSNKTLFFSPGRYTGDFYGQGWQWDDYNAYYQAEINELPLFDNVVLVKAKTKGEMQILPQTMASCFVKDTATAQPFKVVRDFNSNKFVYSKALIPANYAQQIPYKVSVATTVNLLSDTLKKPIAIANKPMPKAAKTIYGLKRDSLLQQMLLPSDNFIAEQLLLACANELGAELNTQNVISYVKKNYLSDLPDEPKWVDGSGLSRGNLFSPRTMVKLLDLIYTEVNNPQKLFKLLPAGGKTGTLKNVYPKSDTPFVFAKTGSLSNNHNQSGYIITKKGKTLIYSFMNNNFVQATPEVRKEMVRIMTYIHDNF